MNVNILVIDDEESIRFSFHRFLAAEGHNVITVKGYREALARIDETEFELILADIFLEDGRGIDILREVDEIRQPLERSVTSCIQVIGNLSQRAERFEFKKLEKEKS